MKRRITYTINTSEQNQTLIHFLARRFKYHTRDGWCRQIEAGRILLNSRKTESSATLAFNDRITYQPEEIAEPPVSADYQVLFEDNAILAVNKPGNLPCHPGGRYFQHTLWSFFKKDGFGESLRFVHRLDRETSGVVLLAKTAEAAKKCQRQFLENHVRKTYKVMVEGDFPETVAAEGFIAPDPDSLIRKKQRFYLKNGSRCFEGKNCCTMFKRLMAKGGISLVEAVPMTGRLHQIRATLLCLGFPVSGDKIYGVDETIFLRFIKDAMTEEDRKRLRFSRQALHAASLELSHPLTGEQIFLEAPMPEDMMTNK